MLAVKDVSNVPSAFKRAIELTVTPLKVEKDSPPQIILPSDCIAIDCIVELKPVPLFVVKEVSLVPSEFKRTIRPTVIPFQTVN